MAGGGRTTREGIEGTKESSFLEQSHTAIGPGAACHHAESPGTGDVITSTINYMLTFTAWQQTMIELPDIYNVFIYM